MQLSREMLSKIDYTQNRFLIDWLDFSSRVDSFETMAELIGMSNVKWEIFKGVSGYSCRYSFQGISIHWAGNNSVRFAGSENEQEVKGARLEMSGSGCRAFETWGNGNWQKLLDYIVENVENISVNRFDMAYDDFLGYLDMDKLLEDTRNRNFVSKARKCQIIESFSNDTSESAYTINHGRMKSDLSIRIYDKRLEQNAQEFTSHWVRNEIMLRHDRAFSAISLLCDEYEYHGSGGASRKLVAEKKPISEAYFLIMNNYLRYIEPSDTDTNKWRAPIAEHWKKFYESVTTYRISLWSKEKVDYNTIRLDNFVENMASSAIFTYISVHGVDKLLEICNGKSALLAPKYRMLIEEHFDNTPQEDDLIDQYLDNGDYVPPVLYTCLCCHESFPKSDMTVYNTKSLLGQCRSCTREKQGVVNV